LVSVRHRGIGGAALLKWLVSAVQISSPCPLGHGKWMCGDQTSLTANFACMEMKRNRLPDEKSAV